MYQDDRKTDYSTAARTISLYLREFCNEWMPYPDMIADAAQKASAEIERLRALQPTEWMIIDSFRYVLGRASCQVSITCEWLVGHWLELPAVVKQIIQDELEEAFRMDDRQRNNQKPGLQHYYLGHNCDRESWQLVRNLWMGSPREHQRSIAG